MSKIGLIGGTFDPIHMGHMRLAEQALLQMELDKILFIPNHIPWMKQDRKITEEEHRLAMVRLAIETIPDYELSMIEIETGGMSYTYQTLETLSQLHPEDELFFILGADSLMSIEQWKHPEKIMKYAALLVAVRDGYDKKQVNAQKEKLITLYQAKIYLLTMSEIDISSTQIRNEFYDNPKTAQMLPAKVAEYIRQNHLYQPAELPKPPNGR
jgi:nicotinate-nucleotide adenylyltransferase